MTRTTAKSVLATPSEPAKGWPQLLLKLQAFQVHAACDMLGMFGRYAAALAAARDASTVGQAQRAIVEDWAASMEHLQKELAELPLAVPPEALAALGWRLKHGAEAAAVRSSGQEPLPGVLEQARLGIEMLLRPWIGAPDLEHTDEIVA